MNAHDTIVPRMAMGHAGTTNVGRHIPTATCCTNSFSTIHEYVTDHVFALKFYYIHILLTTVSCYSQY